MIKNGIRYKHQFRYAVKVSDPLLLPEQDFILDPYSILRFHYDRIIMIIWESLLVWKQRSIFVFRASFLVVLFAGLLIIGSSTSVFGAQLDAKIIPDEKSVKIKIIYQRTIGIVYSDGGEIADN